MRPARVVRKAELQRGPTALGGAIPAAPVVVTAEALAREGMHGAQRSSPKRPEPMPERGSLGSMIRALHLEANL